MVYLTAKFENTKVEELLLSNKQQGISFMTEQLIDLLPNPETITPEQEQIVHLIQGHITLQDQFTQLTNHVEGLYKRYSELEKMILDCTKLLHSKIMS